MSKFPSKQTTPFSLEGRFLGCVFEDGYKLKYIRLKTEEGEWCIKLAKYLRSSYELRLSAGDIVQVVGEKKLYLGGKIKLKAERVIVITTFNQEPKRIPEPTPVKPKATVLVCQKSDCMKRGGKAVCQALEAALSERGLEDQVTIKGTGCLKQCKAGPNIVVMPDKTRYSRITASQIPEMLDNHFPTEQQSEALTLAKSGAPTD